MRVQPRLATILLLAVLPATACSRSAPAREEGPLSIALTSPAFAAGGVLPRAFTCDGEGISPSLAWSGVPASTRSLALVVDDPDAPGGVWVHWVLYDLPPTVQRLAASASPLPPGTREGRNDWKRTGYGAACPPNGSHRYVHTLYALDALLPDLHSPTAGQLRNAMHGHVLARGQLVGSYQRRQR